VSGRAVVGVGFFGATLEVLFVVGIAVALVLVAEEVVVLDLPDAACACTARRETPAMAAKAMELRRFEILRDMTASSGRNDTDDQPAYGPSGVNGS
jgi:hypothetical protein